jgi:hypothetical protein
MEPRSRRARESKVWRHALDSALRRARVIRASRGLAGCRTGNPCRIFAGYPVSQRRPHARHPAKSALRAEKKQNFSLFFRRRRNFSSLSGREISLVNRDLSIKWDFDFKSDRLLAGQVSAFARELKTGELYSNRTARAGAMRAARQAGRSAARSAAPMIQRGIVTIGSVG